MRHTRSFRWGIGRLAWEIRFVFTPRMWMIGAGWDEPDPLGRPWVRATSSIHLLCLSAVVQRAATDPDPQAVTEWMAANADRG